MDEERGVLVFADEEGNEVEMDVIDVFSFGKKQYALLMAIEDIDELDEDDDGTEADVYIMEMTDEDGETAFLPVGEEMADGLEEEVFRRLNELDMPED